jgi:hypothetical protein
MPRSTKKSITVPNPVREGIVEQVKGGILEYPSDSAARIGLVRYQPLIGEWSKVTSAVVRMQAEHHGVTDDLPLDLAQRGLSLEGQFVPQLNQASHRRTPRPRPSRSSRGW